MTKITQCDYERFLRSHRKVNVGGVEVRLHGRQKVTQYSPPEDYELERGTVWSFPDRGGWATHTGDYRGNWSPYIPHNLILKFTKKGDMVLDPMVGGGTTLIECRLLGRRGIGVDINQDAIMITRDRLNFTLPNGNHIDPEIETFVGDARNLNEIEDETIDLIATHPPYAKIISYTRGNISGDLSSLPIPKYLEEIHRVAEECIRVLKQNGHCTILVGDTRRGRHYIPLAVRVLLQFFDVGFTLKEHIIKRQWGMKSTRERWRGKKYDFYLITHESLFIFRKPSRIEDLSKLKFSQKWWTVPTTF